MSEVKIPQELLNVIADINFDEIQSQSYSPSHFRKWLCAWHEKVKIELYDFANNHELYQQGRVETIEEVKDYVSKKIDELNMRAEIADEEADMLSAHYFSGAMWHLMEVKEFLEQLKEQK